jgi:hypothetical protein
LIPRIIDRLIPLGVFLVPCLFSGCDYSSERTGDVYTGTYTPPRITLSGDRSKEVSVKTARESEERAAILGSSIELIQRAALQPGGDNFRLATQKLNQYFEGTPSTDYQLGSPSRVFLETQLPAPLITELENPRWGMRDARHLEDCMMYSGIASRVGGTGDDLARTRRVFDWVVQQIQLVPPGSLGSQQIPQVFARPYDLLLRGMGTEAEGFWAERSWLFIALCRQLGLDAGLLTYTRGNIVESLSTRAALAGQGGLVSLGRPARRPIVWLCAVLIDDKAYLFDARVGLPVPGPNGEGIATLAQALADPAILEQMNLPGQVPYGTSRASLLASPSRLSVLIDSSQGYFSPKMKLLQGELSGKNRTILYRDAKDQRDHFASVMGDRFGELRLWELPLEVETRLFTDPQFVEASMQSLYLFRPDFPLVFARIKQLRGEFTDAMKEYVNFRLRENVPQVNNKNVMIRKEVQQGMDAYATQYLALANMERKNFDQAKDLFLMLLNLVSEPGPNQPHWNMFRWGAHANLGRIYEAQGDIPRAIEHYCQADPTSQRIGNLLRARELVWKNPMAGGPSEVRTKVAADSKP